MGLPAGGGGGLWLTAVTRRFHLERDLERSLTWLLEWDSHRVRSTMPGVQSRLAVDTGDASPALSGAKGGQTCTEPVSQWTDATSLLSTCSEVINVQLAAMA